MNGDKRKFLFVSITGLISDIAWQVAKEGHEVRYCIEDEKERDIADGFVPKVRDWEREVDWADVIVFDDTLGQGEKAQALRAKGKFVVGGTPYTDRLEDDRSFGQEELKKEGINIVSYRDFDNFDDAIAYVKQNPERYVIKPSGTAANVKRRLFVGDEDDGQDVIRVLEAYKKSFPDEIKAIPTAAAHDRRGGRSRCILQREGVHLSAQCKFRAQEALPRQHRSVHRRDGHGDVLERPNKLFNSTLKKMEAKLASEGYVGYIDLNCIVNGNGIYPLEFTARFGYPTISIQQEGMTTPIGQFLADLAAGANPKLKVKSGFQIGVRVVVSPFPFDDDATFLSVSKHAAILFKKGIPEEVHIEDVMQVNGQWYVAGTSGVVLVVCGLGQTMQQAQAQAYSRIRNIMIPDMYSAMTLVSAG